MEERGRARPVKQRRFEEPEANPPSPASEESPPEISSSPPSPPPDPIPRTPSDLELRARQLRWIRERERMLRSEP
jgi:hypothetical protein